MLSEAKHLHYLLEKKQMQILRFAALRMTGLADFFTPSGGYVSDYVPPVFSQRYG
jgi:hypothetical protein